MSSIQEIHKRALKAADEFKESESNLMAMYRDLAQEENIKLIIEDKKLPRVSFEMSVSSGLVLLLIDARKRLPSANKQRISLPEVMEKLLLQNE